MGVTCIAAVATRDLRFGEGTRRWAVGVPAPFVVVRNVAPIITLFAENAMHPESAPRTDLYTVGSLSCIALGILFYEIHDLGGSALGLGLLLLNMAVASLERLLQRRLLAVDVVDVSKPGMMLLNN